ncbi:group I truncated hemoglobin [Legionella jordanis]|uniref:Group 1 truncated hemoglobin n=1 Tax=Legionella jordanis TaxID=456 RepID=A0A0W0VA19_9GAMM|nr:group 1 truncated hemoglobin [Legionella jordanis]KTD16710.1 myoglobin-like protein [Legionella jordanis]RMX03760.1 group 1 truncated hemoglobin [Legionella jordanis]RMX22178.1 group 1 truncated hemoglobin [Legionella jordanis]VEH11822.1 myoglobin-like protein [Legionella jordanis]HAT8712869.1 group 1 truncated hemoglobin [Legionella jordanis]
MPKTLFERLGGADAVNTAVDIFYRKMLTDDRVRHFFDDVDMEQQIVKQKGFLTMVFGGANNYQGKDMREGHRHLLKRGLNDNHVDVVIGHLRETLVELGACEEDIQEVANIANSVRDDVLGR